MRGRRDPPALRTAASHGSGASSERSDGGAPPTVRDAFSGAESRAGGAREQLFTTISPVYDVLNDALSLGLHRQWKRQTVSLAMAGVDEHADCLDVCCGSGDLAFLLARAVGRKGTVTGLDFSKNMLDHAASRAQRKASRGRGRGRGRGQGQLTEEPPSPPRNGASGTDPLGRIRWVCGDAMAMPFDDAVFDCATMGYGLRNVTDRRRALAELCRVLKPGGRAAILDFNSPKARRKRDIAVRAFRNTMLDWVVVPVASVCGLREEYRYLKPSISSYPEGTELERIAMQDEVGFRHAKYHVIVFGLMGILVCEK